MNNITDFIKRDWALLMVIAAIVASIMIASFSVFAEELAPAEIKALEQAGENIPVPMTVIAIPVVQLPVVVLPTVVIPQVTIVTTITSDQLAMLVDSPNILVNKIVIPSVVSYGSVFQYSTVEPVRSSVITIPSVVSYGSVFSYDTPVRTRQYSLPVVGTYIPVAKVDGIILPSTITPTVTQYGTPFMYAQLPMSKTDLINKVILPAIEDAGKGVNDSLGVMKSGIARETVFQKTDHPKNFITDKRTVRYMKDSVSSNLIWKAWKLIYSQDYPPMAYVQVPDITQIKMICEMRATQSQAERDNLMKELTYFKTLGYNTVLAVWEGEETYALAEQIAIVKGMGYKVFFTYGTRERLEDKIFMAPAKYAQGLQSLASQCNGFLVGWRRTSLHLFKADNKFVDYTITSVRLGNPAIPVFGEIYRGFAGSYNKDGSDNMNEYLVNIPANASGAIVVNFGYQGVRPDGVLKLIRASTDVPLIALVVGERPYYMTQYDNKKSKAENRTIIDNVEKRFKKYDFGTATLAGDGSNEIYNKNVSDDISKMNWSK